MAAIARQKGATYQNVVSYNYPRALDEYVETHPIEIGRGTIIGRAVLEGRAVHVPDVLTDAEYTRLESAKIGSFRTMLGVPLLREEVPDRRDRSDPLQDVHPFTDKQIELVTTFADQAVIAIENVRLFDEVQARTERSDRGAGAADRDLRGAAGHLQLARRAGAGVQRDAGECDAHLRSQVRQSVPATTATTFAPWRCTASSDYAEWFRREPLAHTDADRLPAGPRQQDQKSPPHRTTFGRTAVTSTDTPASSRWSIPPARERMSSCRCSRTMS